MDLSAYKVVATIARPAHKPCEACELEGTAVA
jgi:hypothetical protein